jgi:hypothetical protein
MPSPRTFREAINAAFIIAIALPLVSFAQLPPTQPGKPAEQVYKNIQVLRGLPSEMLLPEMRLFSGALGGNCEFCHVAGDNSKDDKTTKQMARQMIIMVTSLNQVSFGGHASVTCYTCHRGSSQPATEFSVLPTVERSPEELEEKPSLPSADAILSKYVQALGGETAIRKVTTLAITGMQTIATGNGGRTIVSAQMERDVKTPNLLRNTYRTDKFTISDGFDGTAAWLQDARGIISNQQSFDVLRTRKNADLYYALDLKNQSGLFTVLKIDKVNGHDAYVLQASAQNDGTVEKFYFDTQVGVLLRILTLQPTKLGNFPSQVDYDDYRATGTGLKIPFRVTMSPGQNGAALATVSTLQVEKIQENTTIDDQKFSKPVGSGSPSR